MSGRPVQFLPVANDLEAEGLALAEDLGLDTPQGTVPTRVLRAEYPIANALKVGRAKDLLRILQFLDEKAVALPDLAELLKRHNLRKEWKAFCRRAGVVDPLGL